jgi:hypothetical protein
MTYALGKTDPDMSWPATMYSLQQRLVNADWVRNLEADPHVRVKVRGGPRASWRSGTAHVLDGDDPRERQRILGRGNLARLLCLSTSKAMHTTPLTVRIDLDPP